MHVLSDLKSPTVVKEYKEESRVPEQLAIGENPLLIVVRWPYSCEWQSGLTLLLQTCLQPSPFPSSISYVSTINQDTNESIAELPDLFPSVPAL